MNFIIQADKSFIWTMEDFFHLDLLQEKNCSIKSIVAFVFCQASKGKTEIVF